MSQCGGTLFPISPASPKARWTSICAHWCVPLFALLLGSCAQKDAEVFNRKPALTGAPGLGPLALAEQAIAKAMREEHAHPLAALGDCIAALHLASHELEVDPKNAAAVRDYNFGIARAFQIIHDSKLDPGRHHSAFLVRMVTSFLLIGLIPGRSGIRLSTSLPPRINSTSMGLMLAKESSGPGSAHRSWRSNVSRTRMPGRISRLRAFTIA